MTIVINKVEPAKGGKGVEKAKVTPRLYRRREPIHPKRSEEHTSELQSH